MLRMGLRLYLQHRLPGEWDELDLGPESSATHRPEEPIDSTAEDLPDRPTLTE